MNYPFIKDVIKEHSTCFSMHLENSDSSYYGCHGHIYRSLDPVTVETFLSERDYWNPKTAVSPDASMPTACFHV